MFSSSLSLYSVKAVIILDSDGKRVLAKYYTNDLVIGTSTAGKTGDQHHQRQQQFERQIHEKSKKQPSMITTELSSVDWT